jgi:hypothetical protein
MPYEEGMVKEAANFLEFSRRLENLVDVDQIGPKRYRAHSPFTLKALQIPAVMYNMRFQMLTIAL